MADHEVRHRFVDKLIDVPNCECRWWTGALSGRGGGRFWSGEGQVVIAHRFALVYGAAASQEVPPAGTSVTTVVPGSGEESGAGLAP